MSSSFIQKAQRKFTRSEGLVRSLVDLQLSPNKSNKDDHPLFNKTRQEAISERLIVSKAIKRSIAKLDADLLLANKT